MKNKKIKHYKSFGKERAIFWFSRRHIDYDYANLLFFIQNIRASRPNDLSANETVSPEVISRLSTHWE